MWFILSYIMNSKFKVNPEYRRYYLQKRKRKEEKERRGGRKGGRARHMKLDRTKVHKAKMLREVTLADIPVVVHGGTLCRCRRTRDCTGALGSHYNPISRPSVPPKDLSQVCICPFCRGRVGSRHNSQQEGQRDTREKHLKAPHIRTRPNSSLQFYTL